MATVSTNDHANHAGTETKGTDMNVQVVLSGSDLELFRRQAAFTLEMAANDFQEALRLQREDKHDVEDEDIVAWRSVRASAGRETWSTEPPTADSVRDRGSARRHRPRDARRMHAEGHQ